jgi:hypothetical protein
MALLQQVTIKDGQGGFIVKSPILTDCFFELPPSNLQHIATGTFSQTLNYKDASFYPAPCAHIVELST